MTDVVLLNPLGASLAHYQNALSSVLERTGADVRSVGCVEPSRAGVSRVRWLSTYLQAARAGRGTRSAVHLAIWPALGHWDIALLPTVLQRRLSFVLHDPQPLVHARGYGSVPRAAALAASRSSETIVHSQAAVAAARQGIGPRRLTVLPHPTHPASAHPPAPPSPVVRVLGQYKAERDLQALARIGAEAPPGWQLEIIGRGWPEISGWSVNDSFVSEDEFTDAIRTSTVVLVPYTRFFQSGVAIRCLENGVPIVGPADSSLKDLLGTSCSWLVHADDWLPHIAAAIASRPSATAQRTALALDHQAVTAWRAWIQSKEQCPS